MGLFDRLSKRLHNTAIQKAPFEVLVTQREDLAQRRQAGLAKYMTAAGRADYPGMEHAQSHVGDHQEMLTAVDNRLEREFNSTQAGDADQMRKWVTLKHSCDRCGRSYLAMIEKCVVCDVALPEVDLEDPDEYE